MSAPAPKEPMHDPWTPYSTPYHILFRCALLRGAPFGRETIGSSCTKLQEPALLLCFPRIILFSSTFCFSSSSSSYVLSPKSAHPVSPKSPKPLAVLQQAAPPPATSPSPAAANAAKSWHPVNSVFALPSPSAFAMPAPSIPSPLPPLSRASEVKGSGAPANGSNAPANGSNVSANGSDVP